MVSQIEGFSRQDRGARLVRYGMKNRHVDFLLGKSHEQTQALMVGMMIAKNQTLEKCFGAP